MSALTLLAFLFFLHILQQCIKEQMVALNTPQITIMTGGREGEGVISKKADSKIDKYGVTASTDMEAKGSNLNNKPKTNTDVRVIEQRNDGSKHLLKINTAEPPRGGAPYSRRANKT